MKLIFRSKDNNHDHSHSVYSNVKDMDNITMSTRNKFNPVLASSENLKTARERKIDVKKTQTKKILIE